MPKKTFTVPEACREAILDALVSDEDLAKATLAADQAPRKSQIYKTFHPNEIAATQLAVKDREKVVLSGVLATNADCPKEMLDQLPPTGLPIIKAAPGKEKG